jgi:hypothetical protein
MVHNAGGAAYNDCDCDRMKRVSMRFLHVVFAAGFAGVLAPQLAHADITTWVDASGTVNVSNLDPPAGARVTKVIRESASKTTRDEAARDAARRTDVQALTDRVQELEDELERGRRPAPAQVEYRAVPVPTPVPYPVPYPADPAPAPAQYTAAGPYASGGCDPAWISCGSWWNPYFYPYSVVVVKSANFRRGPNFHNGRPFGTHQPAGQHPMRVSAGGFPRR